MHIYKYLYILCLGNFCAHLSGWNSAVLSMLSGSVMSGKNAAPPSESEMTNFTADHTAILWNGVIFESLSSLLVPDMALILMRNPVAHISKDPDFSFCKGHRISCGNAGAC